MSNDRYDPLGLAELDSGLADDASDVPGLPSDRAARIAARRAFVEMKQLFMRAVADLHHRKAPWLRGQVRLAEDPIDLWLLRGPLLAALREDDGTRPLRAELYRSLDRTFPQAFGSPTALAPRQAATPAPWRVAIVEAKFSDAR